MRTSLVPANNKSRRMLLESEGRKCIFPLDMEMGIDSLPFKMTVPMMLEVAYQAVKASSYQDAEEALEHNYGLRIGDDTVRKVTNFIGEIVFKEDCRIADEYMGRYQKAEIPFMGKRPGTLYIMADGAAINTRQKDNNGSSWRENKLGLVFGSDHIHYWTSARGTREHKILKREYISLIGTAEEFKKHLFALAVRNGYGEYDNVVILSDGATWIRNMKEDLFPDAQQILDLFHAKENTHKFSKLIFRDEEKAETWAKDICARLENGEWQVILGELKEYEGIKVPDGYVNLYTYLSNNKENIDYPEYVRKGFFVGSGAIESGNKIVLQDRLKLSGMRWNVPTAQYMVSLKAKLESGLWFSYVEPLVKKALGNR